MLYICSILKWGVYSVSRGICWVFTTERVREQSGWTRRPYKQYSYRLLLTHWGLDKMAAIFQTTFSNGHSWMKMYEFWLTFHYISLMVPINNIPTLIQVIAWRRPGDKPLSEPMMVRLPTHMCVTRPQWVNCYTDSLTEYTSRSYACIINKYQMYVVNKR